MQDPLPIQPIGRFAVTLRPPGSKSLTNRALLLAALAVGKSKLSHVLFADDSRVMIKALQDLGFTLEVDEAAQTVVVHGRGGEVPAESADLFLGNAGTAMRFLTAAMCLGKGVYTLDGVPRMRQRPIGQLVEPLRQLGAKIEYLGEEGFPPLRVTGGSLRGGAIDMAPTLSSQYISAMLQIGSYCPEGLELRFASPIISLPYVKMTLELMNWFGVEHEAAADFSMIRVAAGARYECFDWTIEPDASNASYFLAAAAVIPGSSCTIESLGSGSLQGDAEFAGVLAAMGADVTFLDNSITVVGPATLEGIDIDLNAMPDMAQTLGVVALFAEGETVIRNIGNLRVKETDRLAALQNELTKLGAKVVIEGDDLSITPPRAGRITPADIETYDDHRMAMSFAIAGLRAPGVRIRDPACVNKTYPNYFEDLDRLRAGAVRA
jgi:3-phosphoshikimate 1-carboxyvinyltransferase